MGGVALSVALSDGGQGTLYFFFPVENIFIVYIDTRFISFPFLGSSRQLLQVPLREGNPSLMMAMESL